MTSKEGIHQWIYAGGLGLMAAALPSSVFLMSLSQIILFLNWLAEGGFRLKFRRVAVNRPALVFISIYLVHIIALFYSSNFEYGLSTLKSRLPILLLTIIVVSSPPLPRGIREWILLVFSLSITVVSLISLAIYVSGDYSGYRELSPFISHIRMSLMVALSVITLSYLAINIFRKYLALRLLLWGLAFWHLLYLLMLHSLSGVVVFAAATVVLMLREASRAGLFWRRTGIAAAGLLTLSGVIILLALWSNVTKIESYGAPKIYSPGGSEYYHEREALIRENGYLIYSYIAENELREAWNSRSEYDFDDAGRYGDPVRPVLYRYMSSLGLRKDAHSFGRLDGNDIEAVEKGVPNYRYTRWPWIITRVHQSLWELNNYRITGEPLGHTLAQRFEFWKAAIEAIREKPVFGWGTGDIREASLFGLQQTGSALEFERWMKPHNQYLSFAVLFGIPGMLWILFALVYPGARLRKFGNAPYLAFFIILSVSMLNEDTIDTQAGLSFFVFFSNYFLFLREESEDLHP